MNKDVSMCVDSVSYLHRILSVLHPPVITAHILDVAWPAADLETGNGRGIHSPGIEKKRRRTRHWFLILFAIWPIRLRQCMIDIN